MKLSQFTKFTIEILTKISVKFTIEILDLDFYEVYFARERVVPYHVCIDVYITFAFSMVSRIPYYHAVVRVGLSNQNYIFLLQPHDAYWSILQKVKKPMIIVILLGLPLSYDQGTNPNT